MAAQQQSLLNVQSNLASIAKNIESNINNVIKHTEENLLEIIKTYKQHNIINEASIYDNTIIFKLTATGKYFWETYYNESYIEAGKPDIGFKGDLSYFKEKGFNLRWYLLFIITFGEVTPFIIPENFEVNLNDNNEINNFTYNYIFTNFIDSTDKIVQIDKAIVPKNTIHLSIDDFVVCIEEREFGLNVDNILINKKNDKNHLIVDFQKSTITDFGHILTKIPFKNYKFSCRFRYINLNPQKLHSFPESFGFNVPDSGIYFNVVYPNPLLKDKKFNLVNNDYQYQLKMDSGFGSIFSNFPNPPIGYLKQGPGLPEGFTDYLGLMEIEGEIVENSALINTKLSDGTILTTKADDLINTYGFFGFQCEWYSFEVYDIFIKPL